MAFKNIQFPTEISSGSQGGPGFNTGIVTLDSGHERRRVRWPLPLHKYDVSYGVKTPEQMKDLIEFFYIVQGRAHTFRFKDPLDYSSTDWETTITYDDVTLVSSATAGQNNIQLLKSYNRGSTIINRIITKPVQGTLLINRNGNTSMTEGAGFSVDWDSGIITFDTGLSGGEFVRAGFEFDVPCRFDTDELQIEYNGALVTNTSVPVVEVRV